MCFDVDHQDPLFERPDVPRPFFVVVNPVSGNSHAAYKIRWTHDDCREIKKSKSRYERARQTLTHILRADPSYNNIGIRSPFFKAGHHRKNPRHKYGNKILDLRWDSIFHRSIWYGSQGHTLDQLESICGGFLSADTTSTEPADHSDGRPSGGQRTSRSTNKHVIRMKQQAGSSPPFSQCPFWVA
jgi:hypothetical protein